jgi:hypothetical protein
VKRFVAALLLACGLLLAGGANATPVNWTIPSTTTTSGTYTSTISGTFTWDNDTQQLTNVNVSITYNGTPYTANLAGTAASNGYLHFESSNTISPTSIGAYLTSLGLTNSGGSVSVGLGIGPCVQLSGNLCQLNDQNVGGVASVTISGVAVASVPTLSEWTQLLLGLMVMMLIGWHFHRERGY